MFYETRVDRGDDGMLRLRTPYNPALVAALKAAVPTSERKWNRFDKVWEVHPRHARTLEQLVRRHLGEELQIPKEYTVERQPSKMSIDLHYLGACRDRGGGESAAYGWDGRDWRYVISESVLRSWFGAPASPDDAVSLYAVLGVRQGVGADVLRKAYRRIAFQWHPDRCKEPDAKEQFQAVQHAYEVLSDPVQRAKYDAGLALAATVTDSGRPVARTRGYRAPLRTGRLEVMALEMGDKVIVHDILDWQDIQDAQGRTLYAEWDTRMQEVVELWVCARHDPHVRVCEV